MKYFLTDPETNRPSELVTLTVIVTLAAVIRFLFDGVAIKLFDHSLTISHVDASVYLAFLTPVLGLHGYVKRKSNDNQK